MNELNSHLQPPFFSSTFFVNSSPSSFTVPLIFSAGMSISSSSPGPWKATSCHFSSAPDSGIRANSGFSPISERSEGSTSTPIPTVDQLRAAVDQLDVKMKQIIEIERQAQIRFEKRYADWARDKVKMNNLIWGMHRRPSSEYIGHGSTTSLPVEGSIKTPPINCSMKCPREEPLCQIHLPRFSSATTQACPKPNLFRSPAIGISSQLTNLLIVEKKSIEEAAEVLEKPKEEVMKEELVESNESAHNHRFTLSCRGMQ